jgi:Tfp pilus assembly protein PilF
MRRWLPAVGKTRGSGVGVVVALMLISGTAGLAAGCGAGETDLSARENQAVAEFRLDVAMTALNGSGYEDLLDSMDKVIQIARSNPDALYITDSRGHEKRTMRQVLADAASSLAPYDPALATELDRAAETLP